MFEQFASFALVILVFVFCFLVYKTHQYSLAKTLKSRVSWCVTDNSNIYRCNMSLLEWLCNVPHYAKRKERNYFFPNADKSFPIDEKYWLSGEEELNIAKEILYAYQKELSQEYFSGQLSVSRFVCKLSNAEYFLVTLKEFLEKYECKDTFNDKRMYSTKSYKSFGSWGVPLFDATYELTDFAVVYHKIYLIAQIYCLALRENPLDTTTTSYHSAEYTKKVLDTREMEVSRY